ncbi:hypothetical protein TcasGA2_TC034402 [Tribolium castaneum]|uniref:Uncharacterized protein n=1 Tax=Tribolium castaneum TaxID=7070 RepID=A0A139WBS6_TRICA|nr:hypothetical protein TcasGA2_TC034402 [Tribolium castaneum]
MKHICFRFYKKKKDKGKLDEEKKSDEALKADEINQTSKPSVNDGKTQSSSVDIDDIIAKAVCNCTRCDNKKNGGGGGGGCNTNTIIIPRDKPSGDGVASLENFLKTEAKLNSRHMEEILNEIQKQRREILEVKDMLDIVIRGRNVRRFAPQKKLGTQNQLTFDDRPAGANEKS